MIMTIIIHHVFPASIVVITVMTTMILIILISIGTPIVLLDGVWVFPGVIHIMGTDPTILITITGTMDTMIIIVLMADLITEVTGMVTDMAFTVDIIVIIMAIQVTMPMTITEDPVIHTDIALHGQHIQHIHQLQEHQRLESQLLPLAPAIVVMDIVLLIVTTTEEHLQIQESPLHLQVQHVQQPGLQPPKMEML